MITKKIQPLKAIMKCCLFMVVIFGFSSVFAVPDADGAKSMTSIAGTMTGSFKAVATIIHAVAILGGIAFFVAFAFKAKQHRDNPTQVTIGQPLMYLFLAIILAMLPYFMQTSTKSVFGTADVQQWNSTTSIFGPTGGGSGSGSGGGTGGGGGST